MKNQYRFVMPNDDVRYVAGKGRQSACQKLTGMRVAPALAAGQIKSVEKVEDEDSTPKARK